MISLELKHEISNILSNKFHTEIKLQAIEVLSEEIKRNFVSIITLKRLSENIPKTVIFKQSLLDKDSQDDGSVLARFARDWAGLEFISGLKTAKSISPKFYGGSINNRYMLSMARFHGLAYKNTNDYLKILRNIYPEVNAWQDGFKDMPAKIKSLLEKLNIEFTAELESEMKHVFKLVKDLGPFTALMHGDICPDNLVDDPNKNQMKIIDFEWSYVGNALLDAVYLRMYMPTCWCVMAFPDDIIEEMELVYRAELSKFIPEAKDDKLYYEYYLGTCAYTIFWRLLNIEYVLDKEMSQKDQEKYVPEKWKAEYNISRPRQLLRLKKFIELANKHDALPHIKLMAEAVLDELNKRWLDVKPMEYYPAFR